MENDVAGSLCFDVAKDVDSHLKTLNPQSRSPHLLPYIYLQPFIAKLPVQNIGQFLHDEETYFKGFIIIIIN